MEIIKEGKRLPKLPHTFVKKCWKCGCIFTYTKEEIRHPHVLEFAHLDYIDCPWCGNTMWPSKHKIYKK